MKVFFVLFLNFGFILSQNLFFSEYIEGSSYNKALEIFNPANDEIELTGWELWRIANGGDWTEGKSNAVNLSNYVISATNVFVLCHSSIDSEYYSLCNLTGKNTTIFNGDDAIALTYNDVIIDVIGESGDDPGTGWDVAGESNATKNHTLVRSSGITSGNGGDWTSSAGTNSDNSEWIVLSEDDFTDLGAHNCNSCSGIVTICDDNSACNFNEEGECTYPDENECDCDGNILDCANICGGEAKLDNCGNCDNDPANDCVQDCSNTWGGTLTVDVCGICGGPGAVYECGCEDIPDGKCDCNNNELDSCNVCAGDNSTCIDCNGVLDGTAEFDNCGNCVGGDTNLEPCIQDCGGTWGGSLTIDECGVCGGPGAVYECGCEDIPDGKCDCNGNELDNCNVCAGDNSTCMDCNGVLDGTADVDNCGNCVGGDTNLEPCTQDCSGALGGSLTIDVCGECGGSIDDTLNCNLKIKAVNPNKFPLLHSYPNPFNSTTTISILYKGYAPVKLDIIDLNGRIIDSIFSGHISGQNSYTFLWDGTENKSGIYFARMSNNKNLLIHKIILLK